MGKLMLACVATKLVLICILNLSVSYTQYFNLVQTKVHHKVVKKTQKSRNDIKVVHLVTIK